MPINQETEMQERNYWKKRLLAIAGLLVITLMIAGVVFSWLTHIVPKRHFNYKTSVFGDRQGKLDILVLGIDKGAQRCRAFHGYLRDDCQRRQKEHRSFMDTERQPG
jgi:uncharacterized membrane protein